MIDHITIENFKSLKRANLKLGRLNLFIGTNASGKSNLFDALRVLRGLAGGFSLKELFEGGVRTAGGDTGHGIRGGLAYAINRAPGAPPPAEARIQIQFATPAGSIDYQVKFNSAGATTQENLKEDGKEVFYFDGHEAFFRVSDSGLTACFPNPFLGSQAILAFRTGLAGAHKDFVEGWMKHLLNMQFLELDPGLLRRYGAVADLPRMGERGENFASLVRHICANADTKKAYLSWLRELRPQEVDDVTTLSGAVDEPLFALRENGQDFPAPVLSDGTLRFAALAAAPFQPSLFPPEKLRPEVPRVLTIEEIENGIHGSRLRLLMELLRSQAAATNTQVLATTHSPLLLAWLKPDEYATTFLCKRDETTGESRIVPLTEIPRFQEIIGKQSIAELFAEGWMEAAL